MGFGHRKHSLSKKFANHVDAKVTHDFCADKDLKEYEGSADLYDQRALDRDRMRKGDWWIAVGLYMILFGMAFVIF